MEEVKVEGVLCRVCGKRYFGAYCEEGHPLFASTLYLAGKFEKLARKAFPDHFEENINGRS